MNPPITSDQQFPPPIQVDVTGVEVITQSAASQAPFATQSRFPSAIENPILVGHDGRFRTEDGRSGMISISYRMGQAFSTCHWAADDGTECGGYVDLTRRSVVNRLRPHRERIIYAIVGTQGHEGIMDPQTREVSLIRPIQMITPPTNDGDVFVPTIYRAIPTEFEINQEVLTYDGSVGTEKGRGKMADFTIGDTNGKFDRATKGKGSYIRDDGAGPRVVYGWENFIREGNNHTDEVTDIWRSANRGDDETTIQVPLGCKTIVPAGTAGESNYTGYFSPSVNQVV